MNRFIDELVQIKHNLKGVRDDQIRRKVRLIIRVMESTCVSLECDQLGITRKTFYDWRSKLIKSDFDINSLKNKSHRPKNFPNQTSKEVEDELIAIRADSGIAGHQVSGYYEQQTGKRISHSTVDKIFKRRGISNKYRVKKENPHKKRYSAEQPGDRVQFDTVWLGINDEHDNSVYAVIGIDDCSRMVTEHVSNSKGGYEALEALQKYTETYGKPKLVQTDNGVEFTYRYISEMNTSRKKKASLSGFEQFLKDNKIQHHLIKPRTPQHNGKVERFNKTLKREMSNILLDGLSMNEIKKRVHCYIKKYNYERRHSSLNYLTPSTVFYQDATPRGA